jgi:hypothetical protein
VFVTLWRERRWRRSLEDSLRLEWRLFVEQFISSISVSLVTSVDWWLLDQGAWDRQFVLSYVLLLLFWPNKSALPRVYQHIIVLEPLPSNNDVAVS